MQKKKKLKKSVISTALVVTRTSSITSHMPYMLLDCRLENVTSISSVTCLAMAKDKTKWLAWKLIQCKISTAALTSMSDVLLSSSLDTLLAVFILLLVLGLLNDGKLGNTCWLNQLFIVIALSMAFVYIVTGGPLLRPTICLVKIDLKMEKVLLVIAPFVGKCCPKPLRKRIKKLHKLTKGKMNLSSFSIFDSTGQNYDVCSFISTVADCLNKIRSSLLAAVSCYSRRKVDWGVARDRIAETVQNFPLQITDVFLWVNTHVQTIFQRPFGFNYVLSSDICTHSSYHLALSTIDDIVLFKDGCCFFIHVDTVSMTLRVQGNSFLSDKYRAQFTFASVRT
uniref:CNNM transmembrane domain-containing protein n=1 Tax=Steinernema glaseri TaxID=37863 RepID=A0A1I7Z5E9_9BILA